MPFRCAGRGAGGQTVAFGRVGSTNCHISESNPCYALSLSMLLQQTHRGRAGFLLINRAAAVVVFFYSQGYQCQLRFGSTTTSAIPKSSSRKNQGTRHRIRCVGGCAAEVNTESEGGTTSSASSSKKPLAVERTRVMRISRQGGSTTSASQQNALYRRMSLPVS